MALHGAGVKHSSIASELVQEATKRMAVQPDVVLIAGFTGPSSGELAQPDDIVHGHGDADIVIGQPQPKTIDIEEVRGSGQSFSDLMAL